MEIYLLIAVLVLLLVLLAIVLAGARSRGGAHLLEPRFDALKDALERLERALRDEMAVNRKEAADAARQSREESAASLKAFADSLLSRLAEVTQLQKGQLDTFSRHLTTLTQTSQQTLESTRQAMDARLTQLLTDAQQNAAQTRAESAQSLRAFGDQLFARMMELATLQKQQFDAFAASLAQFAQISEKRLEEMRGTVERKLTQLGSEAGQNSAQSREELAKGLKAFSESFAARMNEIALQQKAQLEIFAANLASLTQSNEQKLEGVRQAVETRLAAMQQDNTQKLDLMRQTVDEKLQSTIEQRFNASFQLVSQQLDQVSQGVGQMQAIAGEVGGLKKVLSGIKDRGIWGEVSLGSILSQMLTPDQFAAQVAVHHGTNDRVDYAIRLPGRDDGEAPVWLPIDSKYPQEDYQRLLEAAERGDADAVAVSSDALERRVCLEARAICDKYIDPPHTTDFAIIFLPTESLFAELLRRPGLCEKLMHQYRVVITGPTTLSAVLSSLQMGFRSLTIQKRSSEVWQVLSAVKTEFGKFGAVLDKVNKKLNEASRVVKNAQVRKRAVDRQLKEVAALPDTAPPAQPAAPPPLLAPGSLELLPAERGKLSR